MKKPFDLTFGVGPTQITKQLQNDVKYAFDNNLLSISHRSEQFTEISKNTVQQLRKFLNIPENYEIFYTASATDSWEICARNLVEKEAFCFTNGHFSNSFSECLNAWGKKCVMNEATWGELNNHQNAKIPKTAEIIALCHNETSTGVCSNSSIIKELRNKNSSKILVIDITSSVGCASYNISDADVWYFSVQKGLGLPSGLGVMIVSPNAIKRSKNLLEAGQKQGFYNFTNMQKKMANEKYQTMSTPNILGIYLLGKQLERFNKKTLKSIEQETTERAKKIYNFFDAHNKATPFVTNKSIRSPYTINIKIEENAFNAYKKRAIKEGIQLGTGYGKLKKDCMRIANYSAINDRDIEKLFDIFSD